jgi:hypothetical protein
MNTPLKKGRLSRANGKKESQIAYNWPPLSQEKLFVSRDKELIWKKYCGFLDLSVDEFMVMQRLLLMEQVELAMSSKLGLSIMGARKPKNIGEFRKMVPLTKYEDYQEYLDKKDESALNGKTFFWAHSSGRTGPVKWVPYSLNTLNALANDTISSLILASANRKGDVFLDQGDKIAIDFPAPGISEVARRVLYQRLTYRPIPSAEETEGLEFNERTKKTLLASLSNGIDFMGALAVVLAKMSDDIVHMGGELRSLLSWHPLAVVRTLKAIIKSKIKKQPILPKDIWKVKGLICGGADSSFYRERIFKNWGVNPLDIYISTETNFIAMQGWNKKGMTLLPYSQFYEFIPEKELIKSENDKYYRPSTVLFDELEENKIYELVVTNFHGGPFLRYRIGDLIRVVSLKDEEMKVVLPQIVFFNRADYIYENKVDVPQNH